MIEIEIMERFFTYICEDIPSKELSNHLPNDIEGMLIKLNFRKTK